jgi:hypothetical protein
MRISIIEKLPDLPSASGVSADVCVQHSGRGRLHLAQAHTASATLERL